MSHIDELLAAAKTDRAPSSNGAGAKRVLIATSMGSFNHGAITEKALAIALRLRGADVDIFLCDGAPACQLTKIGAEPPEQAARGDVRARCPNCIKAGRSTFAPLGEKLLLLSEHCTPADRRQAAALAQECAISALDALKVNGWRLGEHARAGALRYFARGDFDGETQAENIARQFVRAAYLTAQAIDRILAEGEYDVVVANHGIYTPQGVIGEVARARGVRVVNWNPAYRRQCFIFSHGESYHHTMITEDPKVWETLALTPRRRTRIETYLADRRQAKGDWIWFNDAGDATFGELASALNLDNRPVVAALSSVVWDACLHYDSNAFANIKDWMFRTIEYFRNRPDLQLVVRVHPAEVTGFVKSRDRMADAIARRFPVLPENVRIIPPDDSLSTYSLIDAANAVLVFSTKTGIEAAAAGAPVIVAGEAWIRNKGLALDAKDPHTYDYILDQLPFDHRLPTKVRERALRYAYHFFYRRMIELPFISASQDMKFEIDVDDLGALAPGAYRSLDCICNGILEGTPFVHDDLEECDQAADDRRDVARTG